MEFINDSLKKKKHDLPACICYSRAFLSSTSDIDVSYWFMLRKKKNENEEYVLYEIEKGNEIDEKNASNTNVENIAKHQNEKETLFFPFSSFEICWVEEKTYKNEKYYHIYLSYLGKYKDKIDKTQPIPETEYTKCIMKTEILDKIEMQQEPNKFTFVISDYVSKEKKKNSIKAIYKITDNDINKKIKILNHSDNNKEEIKKLCDIYFEDKKIDFSFEYTFNKPGKYSFEFKFNDLLTNTSNLFYECKTLKSLDFTKFKTNYIKDMSNMFNGCCLLKSLDLSNFKTKRVTNMNKMFNDCQKLKYLNLSVFDTINVIDMSYMFNNCFSLEYLNLANFKTKSVTLMKGIFNKCNSLITLYISKTFKIEKNIFDGINDTIKIIRDDQKLNLKDILNNQNNILSNSIMTVDLLINNNIIDINDDFNNNTHDNNNNKSININNSINNVNNYTNNNAINIRNNNNINNLTSSIASNFTMNVLDDNDIEKLDFKN